MIVACTNKDTKHVNICKNYIWELHQNNTIKVTHIPGVINASDLFTKELHNATCILVTVVTSWWQLLTAHPISPHATYTTRKTTLLYYLVSSAIGLYPDSTAHAGWIPLLHLGQNVHVPFLPMSFPTGRCWSPVTGYKPLLLQLPVVTIRSSQSFP
jgi:hypothetical protein